MAYQTTQVPVSRSQEQIRKMLINFGAKGVQFTEQFDEGMVNIRFAKDVNKAMRTVNVSMKVPDPPSPRRSRRARFVRGRMVYDKMPHEKKEQMTRATYRALHDWLKAQFVAIDYGLLSFEDVFLSHFEWMINGETSTIGALIKPKLEAPLLTSGLIDDNVIDA